jgi:hypothetical protein
MRRLLPLLLLLTGACAGAERSERVPPLSGRRVALAPIKGAERQSASILNLLAKRLEAAGARAETLKSVDELRGAANADYVVMLKVEDDRRRLRVMLLDVRQGKTILDARLAPGSERFRTLNDVVSAAAAALLPPRV